MKKQRRDHRLMIRVTKAEKALLEKAAASQDVSASWIIRKAIRSACAAASQTAR